MKVWILVIGFVLFIGVVGYNQLMTQTKPAAFKKAQEERAKLDSVPGVAKATFGGGCFWCMEGPFEQIDGVHGVMSGYMGGFVENPTYERVTTGNTGHREVVTIYYDPLSVSYDTLLETYFRQIDPTDAGGQFADRGHQYTTAVYYYTDEQKHAAAKFISGLKSSGKYKAPIVTEVVAAQSFFPAEDYHQDFYKHSAERYKQYKKGSGRQGYIESQSEASR